jgi:hypothetical protein
MAVVCKIQVTDMRHEYVSDNFDLCGTECALKNGVCPQSGPYACPCFDPLFLLRATKFLAESLRMVKRYQFGV